MIRVWGGPGLSGAVRPPPPARPWLTRTSGPVSTTHTVDVKEITNGIDPFVSMLLTAALLAGSGEEIFMDAVEV